MILCVTANPSIDKLFEVESITLGDTHRPTALVQVPGGKGLNVTRAAAALGEDVMVAGLLRGHAGRWVEGALTADGIEHRFVWGDGETRSSLSVSERTSGHLTEFYEAGPRMTAEEWTRLEEQVNELLPGAAWIAISGSLPPETSHDAYARLAAAAHNAGVKTAVDATGGALERCLQEGPDLVKINAREAEELLGHTVHGVDGAHAAALELRERAGGEGRAAVVTIGAEGAILVEPDGTALHGRLYVKGRYPVGSGDSFLAGLLCGLHRGDGWRRAMGLALGAAAANAEVPGAGRLDPGRAAELAAANPGHLLLSG